MRIGTHTTTSFRNSSTSSNSLRGGTVPLWNPFIQSGAFFPSLHNVGFFLPFYQPFLLLGLLVSPLTALEWAVVALQLVGALGLYGLLALQRWRRDVALLGSVAFLTSVLWLNIGQISILFSFATLPWLLVAAHAIKAGRLAFPTIAFAGISSGMAFACGYPWLSVVNTLLFVVYLVVIDGRGLIKDRPKRWQAILFLASCGLTYAALVFQVMPTFSSTTVLLRATSSRRTTGSAALTSRACSNIARFAVAAAASIDPSIYGTPKFALWTLGVGWSMFALVLVRVFLRRAFGPADWFWLATALLGLCYAAAVPPLADVVTRLPLLNGNRLWLLANHYVVLGWIMLATAWLQSVAAAAPLQPFERADRIRCIGLLCAIALLAIWLYASDASPLTYAMLFASFAFVLAAWTCGLQRHLALVLVAINIIGFQVALVRFPSVPAKARSPIPALVEKVNGRSARVTVTTINHRELGRQKYYAYDNLGWSISKTPTSHGYNNLGNPLYWYMKDAPFLERIFDVTDRTRLPRAPARALLATDNLYAEGLAADVAATPDIPIAAVDQLSPRDASAASQHIVAVKLAPNSATATVDVDGRALVLFNNVFAPGWRVTVDGRARDIVSVNYIFMGVEVTAPGRHVVEFRFVPTSAIAAITGVYLAWLLAAAAVALRCWRRRSRRQSAPLAVR